MAERDLDVVLREYSSMQYFDPGLAILKFKNGKQQLNAEELEGVALRSLQNEKTETIYRHLWEIPAVDM
jgi:hypothetical protein